GSSMGGLISLAAIARYPQVFGAAACVSTHWPLVAPDHIEMPTPELGAVWDRFLAERLGAPAGRRIWFDHGDQTLDQYYGPWQSRVDARLIAIGWRPGEDFETKAYPGTGHEENAWAARLPEIFAWLLKASE
ncbi:MAG: esterase family protein, partial [Sphingomonas sp.]|nr:esterase family protein [Sphingomonas sp.]